MGNSCLRAHTNTSPLFDETKQRNSNNISCANTSGELVCLQPHHSSPISINDQEIFFDSRAWLDSDDEDFFSTNGGTPSRSNTPIRHSFKSTAKLSSSDANKQLIDLFRERRNGDDPVGYQASLDSGDDDRTLKGKSAQPPHGCLPALGRTLSFRTSAR